MKEYIEKQEHVVVKKTKHLSNIICDSCGARSKMSDWAKDYYDRSEVSLKMTEGSYYPDGGSSVTTSFDLCPKCFKEKIVPFLNSLGAKETVTNSDW